MKIVIDMNLSPKWVDVLKGAGFEAMHWSEIGDIHAPDHEIMQWAKSNTCVVFTHDLDFGSILAATSARSPSVIQIRTQNVTPAHLSRLIISTIIEFKDHLERGSLISVDERRSRVRVLPLDS